MTDDPLRPGWLPDDTTWRENLRALTPDDVDWFAGQWELTGGRPPERDVSWIKMAQVRG